LTHTVQCYFLCRR